MTEGGVPGFSASRRVVAYHRKLRAEQVREPGTARTFREVQQQVVVLRAQRAQQPDFLAQVRNRPLFFPDAVDGVDLADRRVAGKHVLGATVYERVDLEMRRVVLEHAKHR